MPDSFWGSPSGTVRSAFGKVCPGTTTNIDANSGFGGQQNGLYAVSGPRSAQFTLKVIF